MISQLLFGDTGTILSEEERWYRVKQDYDQYEGWVDRKMILAVPRLHKVPDRWHVLGGSIFHASDHSKMRLPLGAGIPRHPNFKPSSLRIGKEEWIFGPDLRLIPTQSYQQLIPLCQHFMNTPYLWGGKGGFGTDCSGFVQSLFRICGIWLPRDSSYQEREGESINYGQHKQGDLAFFSKPGHTKVTHVGIISSDDTVIHASGKVRLDFLKENGIINKETDLLTHSFVSIKRFIRQ